MAGCATLHPPYAEPQNCSATAVPQPPILWNLLNLLKQLVFWRINSGNNSEITAAEQRRNNGDNSKIISDILATVRFNGWPAKPGVAAANCACSSFNPDCASVPSCTTMYPDCQVKNANT
jgi:hypothetical protein